MKKVKVVIYTIACSFALISCSDDFLNLTPTTEASVENFYQSPGDFNLAVVACYSKLQSQMSYYTDMLEYRSDNLFLNAPTAGTQDRYDIDNFVETPSNGILQSLWANFYNNIFRCNLVLDKIGDKSFDQNLKNQYTGEAKFVRALTYFNLYRAWGGIPVTLKVVSPNEGLKIGRSSVDEIYAVITNDLKDAVNLLPPSYGAADLGRATSNAARALLGKVYLTFGKYPEARDVLSEIIGKYTLQNTPSEVFDINNEMNSEIIFAVRFSKNIVGEGHGLWYTTSDLTTTALEPGLINSYEPNDKRKDLLEYVKSGNSYVVKKYYDVLNPTTQNAGNDFIILRYADVLLLYAEALNEISFNTDPNSAALFSLNEVRKRAGIDPLSIQDVVNKDGFRKALLEERKKEFPFEGQRWYDLVRLNAVTEEMAKVNRYPETFRNVYPIPKTELERINNNSVLWQNPGY